MCGRCTKKGVGIFSQQVTASGNSTRISLANVTEEITYSQTVKNLYTKKPFSFHGVISQLVFALNVFELQDIYKI